MGCNCRKKRINNSTLVRTRMNNTVSDRSSINDFCLAIERFGSGVPLVLDFSNKTLSFSQSISNSGLRISSELNNRGCRGRIADKLLELEIRVLSLTNDQLNKLKIKLSSSTVVGISLFTLESLLNNPS